MLKKFLLKILSVIVAIVIWTIRFVAKKILIAVPWIISAIAALMFGLFAAVRQFFCGEDAKTFIERRLPPRDFPRKKTFSLLTIEVMILLHDAIIYRR